MGKTDKYIIPIYKDIASKYTQQGSVVGMFGFINTDKISTLWRKMDFYDLRLSNWDINSDWQQGKTYKTIVCLRTSGFSKNPRDMLKKFHAALKTGGILLIDWSLGSEHYPRNSKVQSWGWDFMGKRCFGVYTGKKCLLYSSCLTSQCMDSEAFSILCDHSSCWKHYEKVTDWETQVRSEFQEHELAGTGDILKYFDIIYEQNWTPIKKNGRFQLYTIQVLRKC